MSEVRIEPEYGSAGFRIGYLQKAADEGHHELNATQYAYVVKVATRLREWGEIDSLNDLRIAQIDSFYELKLKGNVLGRKNIRVYFGVYNTQKVIVVLGIYRKDEEGKAPKYIVVRMRNRRKVVERQFKVASLH